jgi:hypothetical protein
MSTEEPNRKSLFINNHNDFESKIELILNDEIIRNEYNGLTNDNERYAYIINHPILSDLETRQLRSYILRYGLSYFIDYMENLINKNTPSMATR